MGGLFIHISRLFDVCNAIFKKIRHEREKFFFINEKKNRVEEFFFLIRKKAVKQLVFKYMNFLKIIKINIYGATNVKLSK